MIKKDILRTIAWDWYPVLSTDQIMEIGLLHLKGTVGHFFS